MNSSKQAHNFYNVINDQQQKRITMNNNKILRNA